MDRESINDPFVIQSSIALLQERFRQLQRMKEMREEKELPRKKLVLEPQPPPEQCNTGLLGHDQPSGLLFFQFLPPKSPPPHFSLCSSSRSTTFGCIEAPAFASCLPTIKDTPSSLHVSLNKFQDSDSNDDVDTSLHL